MTSAHAMTADRMRVTLMMVAQWTNYLWPVQVVGDLSFYIYASSVSNLHMVPFIIVKYIVTEMSVKLQDMVFLENLAVKKGGTQSEGIQDQL